MDDRFERALTDLVLAQGDLDELATGLTGSRGQWLAKTLGDRLQHAIEVLSEPTPAEAEQ